MLQTKLAKDRAKQEEQKEKEKRLERLKQQVIMIVTMKIHAV